MNTWGDDAPGPDKWGGQFPEMRYHECTDKGGTVTWESTKWTPGGVNGVKDENASEQQPDFAGRAPFTDSIATKQFQC